MLWLVKVESRNADWNNISSLIVDGSWFVLLFSNWFYSEAF